MTTKVNKHDDPMGVWPTVEPNVPEAEVCKDCGGNCDAVLVGLAESLKLKLNMPEVP